MDEKELSNISSQLDQIGKRPGVGADFQSTAAKIMNQMREMVVHGVEEDTANMLRGAIKKISDDPNAIFSVARELGQKLVEAVSVSIEEFATGVGDEAIQSLIGGFSPAKIQRALSGSLDMSVEGMKKKLKGLREQLKEANGGGLDELSALKGIGVSMGAEKFLDSDIMAKMSKLDQGLTGSYMEYQKAGVELEKALVGPFQRTSTNIGQTATATAETFRRKLMQDTADLQIHFGADGSEAFASLKAIAEKFSDIDKQLGQEFKIKIDGSAALDTYASIELLANQLNISGDTAATYINKMTSTWATGGEVAKESLIGIGRAAADGGIPVERAFGLISSMNSEFSQMGEMSKGLSATLSQFSQNLGPGKLEQAIGAVQTLSTGISGMSDEMKAFISIGSELGGGGTAIESIVRMEEAIASGDQDKLREIQEEMISKIEELSGGAMLTREEAVSTGQEELYFTQAKLSEQFGASKGRTGYDAFVQATRGPAQFDIAGLNQTGDDTALVQRQKNLAAKELSSSEMFARMIGGIKTTAGTDVSENIGNMMTTGSGAILGKGTDLRELYRDPSAEAQDLMSVLMSAFNTAVGGPAQTEREAQAQTTMGAQMSQRTQTEFASGRAQVSDAAQLAESRGASEESSRSQTVLSKNKADVSLENQTAAQLAGTDESLVSTLGMLTTALENLKEQLSESDSGSAKNVTIHITAANPATADSVSKAIQGALGQPGSSRLIGPQ